MEKLDMNAADMTALARSLRKVDFFAPMTIGQLELVLPYIMLYEYSKGETVFKQGAQGDALFIVHEGSVSVQIKKGFFGFSKKVAVLTSHLLEATSPNIVTAVNDDIDIRDSFQVEWALSFRMQPAEDVHVVNNTDPLTLDPSQPWKDGKTVLPTEQVSSKVGIDATKKHHFPPLAVPPKEHLEKVDAQWERYGIREVKRNGK